MKIDQSILLKVADFIKKHKSVKDVNFIFNLGKYSEKFGFEINFLHIECYYKIEKFLNSCSTWDKIENCEDEEDQYESDNEIIDELIILCENGSYDIKLTAEINFYKKGNTIKSYTKKNHIFIISIIETVVEDSFYNFQLLANIPKNYTDIYISESSLLKIVDILSIINPSTEFKFLIV